MIVVENAVLSDDLIEQAFVCDLEKCKGACCIEGDLGAPLDHDELAEIEHVLPQVLPYLSEAGKKAIAEQGAYIIDEEGEYSTPTVGGRECAYAIYDKQGILKCAIEQAYNDGNVTWQKPISCHLYPIRITQYDHYDALNYDRWDICKAACKLGLKLKIPIYKFLKGPLIRKYGESWYAQLEQTIKEKEA